MGFKSGHHPGLASLDLDETGGSLGAAAIAGNVNFNFSKYSGFAAAGVWTLGWIHIADLTVRHLLATGGNGAALNFAIACIGVLSGCVLMFRFFPRRPGAYATKPSPPEPWHRRVTGWLAATVWCAAGGIWNLAIFSVLAQSAKKGQTTNFVILIPFEVVGFFLLLMLFVGVALVLDFIFQLKNEEPPPAPAAPGQPMEPFPPAPASAPAPTPTPQSSDDFSFRGKPVLGTLFAIAFINWFVFFGVSMYLGGEAPGTLPSKEGYVLKDHDRRTPVSESVWVFSLYYDTATLLGTPAFLIPMALWQLRKRAKNAKLPVKIFVSVFLSVWVYFWFSAGGSAFYRSYTDWQKFKHHGSPPSPQTTNTRTNANE